ncbi:unnamed protein product [Colias eurytheme]|nr:unnamed protein product [Colias eurytheme]
MSLHATLNTVRGFLASNYMLVDDEWLSGCVEYLSEDNNYSVDEIKNLAKEQWLLNNLKEICPGSLPKNLKDQKKTLLNGRFVLQINAAVDIGAPAYQQYLKLQKVNTENIEATRSFEDKVKNNRMIKLYMTDGVQDVSGIEYKPMRNLTCDITPGCKVLIKGPIECRRGVMLLTESSIELLGGEVQELVETNSLAGLLSSKLGLPAIQESNLNTTINRPRNTDIPTPHTQLPPPINEPTFEPVDQTSRPIARVTSIQVQGFVDDDIDIDQLAAIEAEFSGNPSKRPSYEDYPQPEKKFKTNTIDDYPQDNDFFEDEDHLLEMEAKFDETEIDIKFPVKVSSEPFVYIKQINDLSDGEKVGRVFLIKGQIIKLLSKLSVGKDGWSLKCTLVDGTGSIDADFTSDVLSKLVGFTPQEMNDIKKQIAKSPELKEKAVSALQKAKDTLQVLYCIIEITVLDVPKITKLIPFEQRHADLLSNRLKSSAL